MSLKMGEPIKEWVNWSTLRDGFKDGEGGL